MKLCVMAPIVGVVAATTMVRAADPTESDCASAGEAAEQLRNSGDLSAARARLAACMSTECSSQLREECARQLTAIEAAMATVVLEAKDEASNNITAVRVTMDGAPLLDGLDGTAVLVSPGEHRLALDAAGFRKTETTFMARERQKNLRVVVFLDSARSPAPEQLTVPPPVRAPPQHHDSTSGSGRRRYIELALGAAGIGGGVVGTIWSIMAKATYDNALASQCGGDPNRCSARGIADGRTAHSQAAVATVAFAAAGALFAAGVALYVTSPERKGVAVAPVVVGSGGVAVVGQW